MRDAAALTQPEAAFAGRLATGPAPTIDLVHLARQCAGDAELEAELLHMFARQAMATVADVQAPDAPPARVALLAHKLRGSALAVGAGGVTNAAAELERAAEAAAAGAGGALEAELGVAVAALSEACGVACALIAELYSDQQLFSNG